MDKELSKAMVLCVVVEGIITYISSFCVSGGLCYQMVLSLILGVFVAFAYKIDLLKLIGIESDMPYVGFVLTGVLFSRGSNYLHDVIDMFGAVRF